MTFGNGNNLWNLAYDDMIFENIVYWRKFSGSPQIMILILVIKSLCITANQKLNALIRVSASMNSAKCSLLINSFIKSQFSYCPLICMFCKKKIMKKVNKIQERYLRLKANNYDLINVELLDVTNQIPPQQRCTAQKMTFSIRDLFSNCDKIRRKLRIWSHLLKKFLLENFIF